MESRVESTQAKRRGPFELSTDTRILYNVMETAFIKDGADMVSYAALSAAIGRNVQKEASGLLRTARKHIHKDYKILLEAVINEGIKRSDDIEGCADRKRDHIRRTSRRARQEIVHVLNGKPMTPSLVAKLGMFGVMELMSRRAMPRKLLTSIEKQKLTELSTTETMKLFLPEQDKA